ncbi:unnamed protein product [Paramecium sonneborni]|uniref:Uncharacterized protein n=1 Tax=Paramecium sonneborni TaxID=65129 RepID=A0A8S1RH32_9CILI|nr:unnamed protein product [Paramecium sonneborni]
MYTNPDFCKPPQQPNSYTYQQIVEMYNQLYYSIHNQLFLLAMRNKTQLPIQQSNYITISDNEESIPQKEIKPTPSQPIQTIQTQKQITQMLDLDQLEVQALLLSNYQKGLFKNLKNFYLSNRKKKNKIKRQSSNKPFRCIQQIQISKEKQLLQLSQSNVKVRLIKVYEKNQDQCNYETLSKLKTSFSFANEDVAVILNISDKNYSKAESFIQHYGPDISYHLKSYKDQQIHQTTQKK